ncbi:MAG: adenosylcobalamin-dependent ribonucleoside-diphosphate reductase [Candidatus Asgardarchaeia archaeon]
MTEGGEVYEYSDALKNSMEYFKGEEMSARVFLDKYALKNKQQQLLEQTPEDMFRRIASEIHRIEKNKFKKPLSYEEIIEYLKDFKRIIPQGSPMSGIGNPYQYVTISNCYVIPSPVDSYGGICREDEHILQISKRRGGVGTDISNLRPNGSATTNAARTSTGIIPFMERYSNSIREVGQSGRRGALMLTISIHHPEVIHFARSKRNPDDITGANISIRLTDEFLDAVKKGKKYEQRFPVDAKDGEKQISTMVDAKEVWMEIIKSAHATAEPGLLFWDNIIRESPADCYQEFGYKTTSTNPCGEIPLCPYDSCRLLLLNLYGYVREPFTKEAYFDFDMFRADAMIAQRFMDDLVDIEVEMIERIIKKLKNDPEPLNIKRTELDLWKNMKKICARGRRTGTGTTALGDTLAALNIRYGSKKSLGVVDDIFKTLKLACYKSSVEMAKELGPFEVWDSKLEKDNPFLLRIKDDDPELYREMNKYGRRNISCLTSAPAGSVSILTQTTSGIEPCYQISYKRRKKINVNDKDTRIDVIDANGDCWQEFEILHPKVKEWMEITGETDITKSPWNDSCAYDIDWINRVKLQAIANKNIDHSISSTLNVPQDIKVEEVAKIYEAAWKEGCKGVTVYRKGCRSGVMVDNTKEEGEFAIKKTNASKRPKILPVDIYHTISRGDSYFVIIGLLGDDPYEIFAGKNGNIKKSLRYGVVKKIKRGKYSLLEENGEVVQEDISIHIDEDQEAITRLISASLRHGCDVSFVVHQLEKVKGDLMSFAKALSRVLKKYIPDDTKIHGEVCKECGGELIREQGCVACKSCGWARC